MDEKRVVPPSGKIRADGVRSELVVQVPAKSNRHFRLDTNMPLAGSPPAGDVAGGAYIIALGTGSLIAYRSEMRWRKEIGLSK